MLLPLGGVCAADPAASVPVAGQHVVLAGTVKRVEAAAQAALFTGDNGHDYLLDLSAAKVVLPPGAALKPGARGAVTGLGNSDGSIAVSRFQLLAPAVPAPIPTAAEPLDYTVRGTAEAVDLALGAFTLRVRTRTRTVYVTPDTDTHGLLPAAKGFPVSPGQRVTVGGSLQPNGTVLAAVLTDRTDLDYRSLPDAPNRILFGPVSSAPNKLRSRDFKVGAASGTETSVRVPRGIPIRRTGRQISVFDLSRRDTVRLTGRLSGADFRAARIDVLAPPPDTEPESPTPKRPGL